MPGQTRLVKLSTANGSDLRQLEINNNNVVQDLQNLAFGGSLDFVLSWQTLAANSLQAMGRGSTDTAVATGKLTAVFGGVPESKAAVTTGLAPTAETVPADTWAIYAIDMVTGGTLSVVPGAANATTGYATEAAAIAALPPRITAKARLGYYTVKTAVGLAWIGGTDALAGGTTGNEASLTYYYPYDGVCAPTGVAFGPNGIVTAGGASVVSANGTSTATGTGTSWTGGRNGVLISAGLAIGSTDTRISNLAFTFNANGATNIAKAAVAAGTALGALGTVPAATWGLLVVMIDGAGTVTYLSGPQNYTTGYKNENAALNDLGNVFPTYVTTTSTANA